MVIFKNRWIKKFLQDLLTDKDLFWSRYQGQIPSNVALKDAVAVAASMGFEKYLTPPHRQFTEASTPLYYQASPLDGYYFFKNPIEAGYVACMAEKGNIAAVRKSLQASDAFMEYMDYCFWQLGSKPRDSRWNSN